MGKSFTSLSQLEAYLLQAINDSLNKEVAGQIKEEIQTGVSETIYQSGIPRIYDRRAGNSAGGMGSAEGTGSLADKQEMHHVVENGVLEVVDDAEPKMPWDRRLDIGMTYGYGDKSQWYNMPRDFLQTARDNIKESKSHVSSLADGLRRNGLIVVE